jgi:hypothetical protein
VVICVVSTPENVALTVITAAAAAVATMATTAAPHQTPNAHPLPISVHVQNLMEERGQEPEQCDVHSYHQPASIRNMQEPIVLLAICTLPSSTTRRRESSSNAVRSPGVLGLSPERTVPPNRSAGKKATRTQHVTCTFLLPDT